MFTALPVSPTESLPHLESMEADSILERIDDIEKYERLARRNHGLSDNQAGSSSLNLHVLCGRDRTLIAIGATA